MCLKISYIWKVQKPLRARMVEKCTGEKHGNNLFETFL